MEENYTAPSNSRGSGCGIIALIMLIPILSGLTFIAGALVFYALDARSVKTCTAETQAVVVDFESKQVTKHKTYRRHRRKTSRSKVTVYAPVVTFTDENGKEHTVTSTFYSDPPVCNEGDTVKLCYDPTDPDNIYLPDFDKPNQTILIPFMVIGALQIAFGVFMLIKVSAAKRRKRNM